MSHCGESATRRKVAGVGSESNFGVFHSVQFNEKEKDIRRCAIRRIRPADQGTTKNVDVACRGRGGVSSLVHFNEKGGTTIFLVIRRSMRYYSFVDEINRRLSFMGRGAPRMAWKDGSRGSATGTGPSAQWWMDRTYEE